MSRLMKVTALAFASALLLVGCAIPSPTAPAEHTTAPATGMTITGSGYSFHAPAGWKTVPKNEAPQGLDSVAANVNDTDGFADNVNVVLSPAGKVTADQVETAGVEELKGAGATEVIVRDRMAIAGSESAHLSAGFTLRDATYQIEQFYLTRDAQTYVVTFSFSPTVTQAERDALSSAVLASWSWA